MKLAFLFPGQGAQSVGMGQTLARQFPVAREVFDLADQTLGFRLSSLCWEGPEAELRQTVNAQPALLAHGVAAWRLVETAGIAPTWVAGHSLGEYSACVAAGALSFEDALRLVRRRGELMQRAGVERPGTMAAFLGLDPALVESICAEASPVGVVVAANLNAPEQVVISGEIAAVERACEIAKARGARRAIRLDVSGAFHSPLMDSAAAGLRESLAGAKIRDARCPVISNAAAAPVQEASAIRASLEAQLLAPVRWMESMRYLLGAGAAGFLELGPGKVLRGLLRPLSKDLPTWNVEDPESLQAALAGVGLASPAERS